MPKYFKKEIPETPLYLSIGKPLTFEYVDQNGFGYLRTDDGFIIEEMNKCISRGTGGVTEISEEEYLLFQAQKKSGSLTSASSRQRQTIGPKNVWRRNRESVADPAAVSLTAPVVGITRNGDPITGQAGMQKADTLSVTREFVKPRVGKIS